jgi:hypothetical protein
MVVARKSLDFLGLRSFEHAQDVAGEREFPHSGAGLTELCDWRLSVACILVQRQTMFDPERCKPTAA